MENIKVSVRFRPLNNEEKKNPISVSIKNNEIKLNSHIFCFDNVFSDKFTQDAIYGVIGDPCIEWILQGYNATIFAYGPTSSGKTYTMFGYGNEKGIIPKGCENLFKMIEKNENVVESTLKCSFVEIYKEQIRDLLSDSDTNLKLREHDKKGVYIEGVIEKYVCSPKEILELINKGYLGRATGSTALNATSSRSHAVLTLTLQQSFINDQQTVSKLNFIDLAGSENVGRSEVQGIALAEAQMINKSLSCLGNVIYALTEKNREHIPYRDSKLTYLLRDSLGGNSKTFLIATASLSEKCYSETLNTLKFSKRVKDIKNNPRINKKEGVEKLMTYIKELEDKIKILESAVHAEHPIQPEKILKLEEEYQTLQKELEDNLCLNIELQKEIEKRDTILNEIVEAKKDMMIKEIELAQIVEIEVLLREEIVNLNESLQLKDFENINEKKFISDLTTIVETKNKILDKKTKELEDTKTLLHKKEALLEQYTTYYLTLKHIEDPLVAKDFLKHISINEE